MFSGPERILSQSFSLCPSYALEFEAEAARAALTDLERRVQAARRVAQAAHAAWFAAADERFQEVTL